MDVVVGAAVALARPVAGTCGIALALVALAGVRVAATRVTSPHEATRNATASSAAKRPMITTIDENEVEGETVRAAARAAARITQLLIEREDAELAVVRVARGGTDEDGRREPARERRATKRSLDRDGVRARCDRDTDRHAPRGPE